MVGWIWAYRVGGGVSSSEPHDTALGFWKNVYDDDDDVNM